MSSSLFSNFCKTDRLCFFFFFGLECFLLWTESPALFLLWLTSLRDILTQQQTNSSDIKESKKISKFLIWQNLQIIYYMNSVNNEWQYFHHLAPSQALANGPNSNFLLQVWPRRDMVDMGMEGMERRQYGISWHLKNPGPGASTIFILSDRSIWQVLLPRR